MGTTGHYVKYFELDSDSKIKEWLRNYYSWEKWEVLDLAKDSKDKSVWWLAMREHATGDVRALSVITSNRAKREGMFYTKEGDETVGPYAVGIPKKLWKLLTPLHEKELEGYAGDWRKRVVEAWEAC